MPKSIKLKNGDYWDATSILNGNVTLKDTLDAISNNFIRLNGNYSNEKNANNLNKTGLYYITGSATNTPYTSWIYVNTWDAGGNDRVQFACSITGSGMWYRKCNSGTWANWIQLEEKYDTGWVDISTFGTYFGNYNGNFAKGGCRREHSRVQLRGLLNVSSERNNTTDHVCTLPAGYRPSSIQYTQATTSSMEVANGGRTCPITIQLDGRILLHNGYCKGWLSLDGISFYVD